MSRTYAIGVVLLVLFFSILAFWGVKSIRVNYRVEDFFDQDSPYSQSYRAYQVTFGDDFDYALIGIFVPDGAFDSLLLHQLEKLSRQLEGLQAIEEVQSLSTQRALFKDPLLGTYYKIPLVHLEEPSRYAADSARMYDPMRVYPLVGNLISQDARALCIYARHSEKLSNEACYALSRQIKSLVEPYGFKHVYYAGRCFGQSHFISLLEQEISFFISLSLLMMMVAIAYWFSSWLMVLISMGVVGLASWWTLAVMGALGKPLNLLTNLSPTIILIVGLSLITHILVLYDHYLRKDYPAFQALRSSLRKVGPAAILTSISTALGFLSLEGSRLAVVRDFGHFTALGVMFTLLLVYTLLPAGMLLLPTKPRIRDSSLLVYQTFVKKILEPCLQYPRRVLFFFLLGGLLFGLGITKVNRDNHLLDDLRESDPIQKGFRFFEQYFSGARSFDLLIKLKDSTSSFWDREVVVELIALQDFLSSSYQPGLNQSLALYIQEFHAIQYPGRVEKAWEDTARWASFREAGQKSLKVQGDISQALLSADGRETRIWGLTQDKGRLYYDGLARRLEAFMQEEKRARLFSYELTGIPVLFDRSNDRLVKDIFIGLLVAMVLIGILLGLVYGSGLWLLAALLANCYPLWILLGLMGFLDIPLRFSTAILFSIAFGIAVDDTVHFLSGLKYAMKQGKTLPQALEATFYKNGLAIVLTSLILCLGFLQFGFSSFLGTFYLGLLLSFTFLVAVLVDLLFLPALFLCLAKYLSRPK